MTSCQEERATSAGEWLDSACDKKHRADHRQPFTTAPLIVFSPPKHSCTFPRADGFSFTPHGVDYEVFKAASEIKQDGAQWISEGTYGEQLVFPRISSASLASSSPLTLDRLLSPSVASFHVRVLQAIHAHRLCREPLGRDPLPRGALLTSWPSPYRLLVSTLPADISTLSQPAMWDPLVSEFIGRLDEVNAHLAKLGLPALDKGNATKGNQGLKTRAVAGGKPEGAAKVNGAH